MLIKISNSVYIQNNLAWHIFTSRSDFDELKSIAIIKNKIQRCLNVSRPKTLLNW